MREKRYAATHAKQRKERNRQWREANREKLKEKSRRYRQANKDFILALNRSRKAKQRGADGNHSPSDMEAIWIRQKGRCANPDCAIRLTKKPGPHQRTEDHITAVINRGSNRPDNMQWLCSTCNCEKHAKDEYRWAQEHGMLFPK